MRTASRPGGRLPIPNGETTWSATSNRSSHSSHAGATDMKLIASAIDFANLERALFASAPAEGAAFLTVEPDGASLRLRSYRVFQPDELDGSAYGHIAIEEDIQVRELAAVKRKQAAAVEVHTHPGSGAKVGFSPY